MNDESPSGANYPELASINRIRVETALSRFPIHRLAKKGSISIDLQRLSDSGEADFRWEVTYNTKHGQPGPLAYKVDTLIVNRRIDEARRPIPEVIRLGSLSSICEELGLVDSGGNIADVKRALHQNASAYITARLRYKLKSGRERWGEIGYTRYSVIFTGETLPDGKTADAVYIVPNASYRDLLNHVEVRPLDYDYLIKLAPGPQRLYELLSFPMYGAIASGRPHAKLVYSDYCLYAPQTRYFTFDQVKKQMYKVHVPHRESGYIARTEYRQTLDRDGNLDWEMFYIPGPKALREYEVFANRHVVRLQSQQVQRPAVSTPTNNQAVQASLHLSDAENALVAELTRRGVTVGRARELVAQCDPLQDIAEQIEYIDALLGSAPKGKFHNPAGFYVRFVQDNAPVPETFWSSRKQRLHERARQTADNDSRNMARLQVAFDEYQKQSVERHIRSLNPEEYNRMFSDVRRRFRRTYSGMTDEQLTDLAKTWIGANLLSSGQVQTLSFDEFCRQPEELEKSANSGESATCCTGCD